MGWLDRERMPVRFTIVTSVASGLIVAVILNVFRTGISETATLMWFTMTAGGVAVASGVAVSRLSRTGKRSRRAFLVTSAFSQKYYIAAFVQNMHCVFDSDGIDLVLKVPDRDYDASAQSHHLSRLLDRRHDYIGGVIFAGEVHRLRDDLTVFCRRSQLPVVFTDLEPFDREDAYPENAAYVGYDSGELGELAGKWLAKHLQGMDRPHVLIIASREHNTRQQCCEQVLRSEFPDVVIRTNDQCAFTRSRAYDAVRAHMRELDAGERLDAIFCTNDEMALGAVDALSPPGSATQATVVVGIDGVLEARTLIDSATSPLQATVVQDARLLAGNVVDVLDKMHRGRCVPKRTILPAEIYAST